MATAPQKIAVRRLVRGADGAMKIILVDAYTYVPVTDISGYKVVDVGDVPEQVQDVNQPDAEKPVKTDPIKTGSTDRGGSEFGGSSSGARDQGFGKVPSTPRSGSFPSAPPAPTQNTPQPTTQAPAPSTGANMPTVDSTGPSTNPTPSTPSTPANPPGYSAPTSGAVPTNYSPSTPNAAAAAAGNKYYTGDTKTYDFQNPNTPAPSTDQSGLAAGVPSGTNVSVNNGITSTSSAEGGIGTGGTASGTASFGDSNFGSGNNNGRGKGIASTPSPSPTSSYGSMYGNVGFGGGYVADGSMDSSPAKDTVSAASAPKSATERSQAMGSVPDSATSPAAAAARGMVSRNQAQLDRIGLTIAGEVTPATLANLTSPDPATQADARAQVANIQATMENRAATAPWGTIEKTLDPGQYNSLMPGKNLQTSMANYSKYQASINATVKDFYSGLNPPTNYSFTNYANTNPIPGVYNPPGWLNNIQDPTQVGPFTFGTDPAYSNPSRYTAEAQANYSAAQADYGSAGAYKASPDFGTDPGWGTYGDPSNPSNGYSYGGYYGQSAIDPGWGGFAGGGYSDTPSGGGYTSPSGNNNGRGSGLGGSGSGSYGGGATSFGGGSGYGGGGNYGGSGSSYGGGAGMSGGGGYSPGGMGSPSGSGFGGGGYSGTSSGSNGNNSGTSTGSGAGTNGSGGSKGAQGRSDGDY